MTRRRLKKAVVNGLWGFGIGTTTTAIAGTESSVPDDLTASIVLAICWISVGTGAGFWYGWTGRSVYNKWLAPVRRALYAAGRIPSAVNAIRRSLIVRRIANSERSLPAGRYVLGRAACSG